MDKLSERLREYNFEVDDKIYEGLQTMKGDVKECNEYITSLHNEIDQSSTKFKKEIIPITSDMNQLHTLLIQANDDNRMMFKNLKIVALFVIDLFDMIKLIIELSKQAENDIFRAGLTNRSSMISKTNDKSKTIQEIGSISSKTEIETLEKNAPYFKKSLKLAKNSIDTVKDRKSSIEIFKRNSLKQIGNRMSIEHRPDGSTSGNLYNLIRIAYSQLQAAEIVFKNRNFTRQECYDLLENYTEKASTSKNCLIFDHINLRSDQSKQEDTDDLSSSRIMKSTTKLPAEAKSTLQVKKIKHITGRATPSNNNYKKIMASMANKEHNKSIFPQIAPISPRNQ